MTKRARAAILRPVQVDPKLREALEALQPAPLEFHGGENPLYVERPDEPLDGFRTRLLLLRNRHKKFLLAGHRGTGKSTELNRLCADDEIRDVFEIVKFSVREKLDINNVGYVEFLLVLAAESFERAVTLGSVDVSEETLRRLQEWQQRIATEVSSESVETAEAEVEGGASLKVLSEFFAGFKGRLRSEHTTREKTRSVVEKQLSDFLSTLAAFFTDLNDALRLESNRQLLVVVEDLDKLPNIERALTLFRDAGAYLAAPPVSMILTIPSALVYSKDFPTVRAPFDEEVLLPAIRLLRQGDETKPDQQGRGAMGRFIDSRLDGLISEDARELAIDWSGGVFQQLQRLLEGAVVEAVTRSKSSVGRAEVEASGRELRQDLARLLTTEDYTLLDTVVRTRHRTADPGLLPLLHGLHVLEYSNGDSWCAVNPLLERPLQRWREQAS